MKASELRPGQFFEYDGKRYRALDGKRYVFNGDSRLYFIGSDFTLYWLRNCADVTPLNVHGWDDEPQSETAPTLQGEWPANCLQRAFVEGAKWWEYQCESATMWQSDRNLAEQEAVRRYGEVRPDPTEEKAKPAPLQLREGAWYRRGDGKVVGPAKYDTVEWLLDGFGYSNDGIWKTNRELSPYDLIAEVPPPVSDDLKAKALGGPDRVLKGKHPDECEFGQEVCLNCGWDKGGDLPKSLVDFDANGDAVCPECGHNACYFDTRDEVPPPVEPPSCKLGAANCPTPCEHCEPPVATSTPPAPASIPPTNCNAESTLKAAQDFTNNGVNSLQPEQVKAGDQSIRGLGAMDGTPPRPDVQKPKPDADGWIDHDGKGCPVPVGLTVKSRQRSGREGEFTITNHSHKLGSDWFWSGSERYKQYDIVAYRLVQPAPITHWVEVVGL